MSNCHETEYVQLLYCLMIKITLSQKIYVSKTSKRMVYLGTHGINKNYSIYKIMGVLYSQIYVVMYYVMYVKVSIWPIWRTTIQIHEEAWPDVVLCVTPTVYIKSARARSPPWVEQAIRGRAELRSSVAKRHSGATLRAFGGSPHRHGTSLTWAPGLSSKWVTIIIYVRHT